MGQQQQPSSDTTLTKVFVGGLAWETNKDALRDHFARFGDILEAVIISDKASGRSKGYGFVTFKDAEAAKKACEDSSPVINGRRANCNLAFLGARRPRTPVPTPAPGARAVATAAGPWYYTARPATPAAPMMETPAMYEQHYHSGVVPFYPARAMAPAFGFPPSYLTRYGYDYNQKVSNGGGSYGQGQFTQVTYRDQLGGMFAPNAMLPVYPLYQFHNHQPHTMGLPAHHMYPPPTPTFMTTIPTIISKPPPSMPPTKVEPVKGCS